jgi:hypothetical protein
MNDSAAIPDPPVENKAEGKPNKDKPEKNSISMHDDVPVWYDCCSCEAEPYWVELFKNMDKDEPQDKS